MKKLYILHVLAAIVTGLSLRAYAEDVESDNYTIEDLTIGAGGGEELTSSSYKLVVSVGDVANDDRFTSSNYQLGVGTSSVWMATAPEIKCFETNTDSMIMICGAGGCYDRAHFELEVPANPSDTLYSIQITTDAGWSSWNYVGNDFYIEGVSSHDINDYLTKSVWESESINIRGLSSGTVYYLRATALHGDFTESGAGPALSATTGNPSITFDLDIAGTGGQESETSAPYSIVLGQISVREVTTASNLIWMDIGTNAPGGAQIFVSGRYGGLYSASSAYIIASSNANLDAVKEGFGLVEYSSTQDSLGPLAVAADYGMGGNIVGGVSKSQKQVYNTSSSQIYKGRAGMYIKAGASGDAAEAYDYRDEVTFTAIATF